jgi:hypothetical protein
MSKRNDDTEELRPVEPGEFVPWDSPRWQITEREITPDDFWRMHYSEEDYAEIQRQLAEQEEDAPGEEPALDLCAGEPVLEPEVGEIYYGATDEQVAFALRMAYSWEELLAIEDAALDLIFYGPV